MTRPLSPGGRGLLRTALDAAADAIGVLAKGAAACSGVVETLGAATDNLAHRCGQFLAAGRCMRGCLKSQSNICCLHLRMHRESRLRRLNKATRHLRLHSQS